MKTWPIPPLWYPIFWWICIRGFYKLSFQHYLLAFTSTLSSLYLFVCTVLSLHCLQSTGVEGLWCLAISSIIQSLHDRTMTLAHFEVLWGNEKILVYFNHIWWMWSGSKSFTEYHRYTQKTWVYSHLYPVFSDCCPAHGCMVLSNLQILADKVGAFIDIVQDPASLWEISEEGFLGNRDEIKSTAASSQTDLALKSLPFTCGGAVLIQLYADCHLEIKHLSPMWTDPVHVPFLLLYKISVTQFKSLMVFNLYFLT